MNDLPTTRALTFTFSFPQPPAVVWRALTESSLIERWMLPNDLVPRIGHRFSLRGAPAPGWDGVVHCTVLSAISERQIAYTWRAETAVPPVETIVGWLLERTPDGGTRLTLNHSGFPAGQDVALDSAREGWPQVRAQLAALLEELAPAGDR